MTLEDLIKLDATGIASQDFDEKVTLYKKGSSAAAVPNIGVVVVREEPAILEEGARVHDATILFPAAAVPTGHDMTTSDEFDVVLRIGSPAERVRVSHITAEDPGFLQLEVRR